MADDPKHKSSGILTVIATALVTLVVLSLLPWGHVTGHRLKDFSLVSDLHPQPARTFITHEELDPDLELLDALTEAEQKVDVVDLPLEVAAAREEQPEPKPLPDDFVVPTNDTGLVLIEDYSADNSGLHNLRLAFDKASSGGKMRIAIVGDSYIEGDILSQDIRAGLQDKFGGSGVGYLAAYTSFPGYRQSVTQSGDGWEGFEIRKTKNDGLRLLQGQYFVSSAGAKATYKGSKRPAHTDTWAKSTILYISPAAGTITIDADDGYHEVYDISPSDDVQSITVNQPTSKFSFSTDITGLKVLGVWLESQGGVQVDNMSLRGNSGISHRHLNQSIAAQMRNVIDYDLIILEFGINALSSEQSNYSAYGKAMIDVVQEVRQAYPNAQIMLLGIGDRGQKQGTDVGSMSTAQAMVNAQRDVARTTGSMFWDMRQAMGGDGAVVDWNRRGLVNSDYIHLNHKGGRELGNIFVKSLTSSISE